jgi:peptidoglycan-associated lipoprotein
MSSTKSKNTLLRAVSRLLCAAVVLAGAAGCATKQAAGVMPSTDVPPAVSQTGPSAPTGAEQDDSANGARAGEALESPTLYYSLDSAQLTPESQERLAVLAKALRARHGAKVTIAGHTCELGTSEYNLALGNQRAVRARDYLVALGVSPTLVTIVSYGEEMPVAEGHDEAALVKNRRAEVHLAQAASGGH